VGASFGTRGQEVQRNRAGGGVDRVALEDKPFQAEMFGSLQIPKATYSESIDKSGTHCSRPSPIINSYTTSFIKF